MSNFATMAFITRALDLETVDLATATQNHKMFEITLPIMPKK